MSSFRPLLSAATICSLVVAPLCVSAQDSSLLPARVDSIAAAVLASTGVPSASIAVVMHGQLAYAQAYGAAKLDPHMAATRDMAVRDRIDQQTVHRRLRAPSSTGGEARAR